MSFYEGRIVEFMYVNHRGEEALRRVVPRYIYFGQSKWHPFEPAQFFLVATCLDRLSDRHFQMTAIQGWSEASNQTLPWRS